MEEWNKGNRGRRGNNGMVEQTYIFLSSVLLNFFLTFIKPTNLHLAYIIHKISRKAAKSQGISKLIINV